ncbi:MAG TPA: transporter associated domain-containing protein [Marinagarivorans sp.]
MSEEPPSSQPAIKERTQERSWIEKLLNSFSNSEPQSREELLAIIKDAASNKLLDDEALEIIEGALSVSNLQVREIMIPRSQMVVIKHDETPQEFLPKIIESCHSRFPVIGESIDDIRGILLAKDLLPLLLNRDQPFELESMLRAANIIPESKRLNVLLKEFREKRYHMAIIIDEYGGISGLVTIEDILEEIVGEIEDETDDDEDDFIRRVSEEDFIIKALTPIEDFNEYFGSDFDDADFDTIGGIVTQAFGHMPSRNEVVEMKAFRFRILYADNRQIHLIRLTKI